jgi:hypothetical protein
MVGGILTDDFTVNDIGVLATKPSAIPKHCLAAAPPRWMKSNACRRCCWRSPEASGRGAEELLGMRSIPSVARQCSSKI